MIILFSEAFFKPKYSGHRLLVGGHFTEVVLNWSMNEGDELKLPMQEEIICQYMSSFPLIIMNCTILCSLELTVLSESITYCCMRG